jgi:hypothetical protein
MRHKVLRLRGHRRKVRPTLLVLALGLMLFLSVGSASALDVLDQEQTSGGGGFLQFNSSRPAAQTFTAGRAGPLGKISVYLGGWSAYTVRAEIWSTAVGKPASVMASTQTSVTQVTAHWEDIIFTAPPTLTAGGRYAIVMWKVDHDFTWRFADGDLYPGGGAYTGIMSGGGWYWSPFINDSTDFAFKTYTYMADTTPPVVTAPTDITAEATTAAGAIVSFSASATDDVDGPLPAGSIHYYTGYGTGGQTEIQSGDLFPVGATTVTAAATDTSGNTGTATFTVSVVDTTAPVLTIPTDMKVEATGPVGAPVFYSVSATDLVDGPVIPRVSPASGLTFPIGKTTVWVSAKDKAGNFSTGSFVVTVLDATGMLDKLAGQIVDAPDDPTAPGGIAPIMETSLLAKVNAALAALNRGNKNDAKVAMNDLKALINQVQAQTAKSISPAAAEAIIGAANRLVDVLNAPPASLPTTKGAFAGLDEWGGEWQIQLNSLGSGAAFGTSYYDFGAGTLSFTSWRTLPDGSRVERSFTMTVDRYHSVDDWGYPEDAGAATGISGPVVASTGGEGLPAVGDFYLFLAWDGAQGYLNADGTAGYYPDTWKFVPWPDTPSYARNFQRTIIGVWSNYGMEHYYPATQPGTSGSWMPLWPVSEGDIEIQGGWVY